HSVPAHRTATMSQIPVTITFLAILASACATAGTSSTASAPASTGLAAPSAVSVSGFYNVRDYGARGDSVTIETDAINRAIEAAAAAGGGTVYFPAGDYSSYSIHLRSNVGLHLEQGATLFAAAPVDGVGYDPAEPGPGNEYQDFGHSHWHNSLMWGVEVENVTIEGQGLINGHGLSRGQSRDGGGVGNKAIALKLSRNITIRDISILNGGHFALLATGVDNLTIDNVKVDTNRDGF